MTQTSPCLRFCFITSPKGFSASKCDVGKWTFSKYWEVFGKFLEIFNDCLHF